ncbi:MAG TPA: ATP-binding cassette domain-containing protein, partial [Acidimicrobiia bacterium]|nr:ATP-binding cassette domain-containing protein [Acidimicrobiia bacterium]
MTAAAERSATGNLITDLPPAAAIWCSRLRKRYGPRPAVDDVSLEVGRGEVVGLLGPNGAGKTTVIKMLLGLVRPDAGEVMLLGERATDPAARARVG